MLALCHPRQHRRRESKGGIRSTAYCSGWRRGSGRRFIIVAIMGAWTWRDGEEMPQSGGDRA
jgi:hypothetical protein